MSRKHSKLSKRKLRNKFIKQRNSNENEAAVTFRCLDCHISEDIPREVVEFLDGSDIEYDPKSAPQFSCAQCGGQMYPVAYTNQYGYEFKISNVEG